MKIITENAVYVQKNDIAYLHHTDLAIPASIYTKVFGNGVVIINDSNRFDFVKFDTPEEIDFFRGIDWIVDYNAIKDLSEAETIALGQSIADEKNSIARRFNSMSLEEREDNMDMVSECELLDFKMYSLRDFWWFKQGHIKMELPKEIDLPDGLKQDKGIRRLVRNLFKKDKK